MRVTSSMYYNSLYSRNNSNLQNRLFDVNKQIASGLKIQYASDDISAFTETMRLDNELVALGQVKQSVESGYKVSNQTDVILNEFDDTMNRMRTLLINAANGTHNETSLDAIADELRVIEDHFKNLANSSINGQYLFSGTAVDLKPINDDGTYMGNDGQLSSFTGSRTQQSYNISGAELFLGEEVLVKREVTTNVTQHNLSQKYDFDSGKDNGTQETPIRTDDTIRDLMGDNDSEVDLGNPKHHFYVSGVKSNGTSFNEQISLSDEHHISDLLEDIGEVYGNTPNLTVVNVSLNKSGQIVVEDKIKGSSKLDFHIVGAVDYNHTDDINGNGNNDDADVSNISALDVGETNFSMIMNGTSTAANPNLYVKEFIKSPYESAVGAPTNIDGLLYDNTQFSKNGSTLSSSIPQIVREDNAFASPWTKISEVADISNGTVDLSDDTLDGNSLLFVGKDMFGTDFNVQIDFKSNIAPSTGSSFTIAGNTYDIFDMSTPRGAVDADEMSYQQLMDVMNMVTTNRLPSPAGTHFNDDGSPMTDYEEYDYAISASNFSANTYLTDDGRVEFGEIGSSDTKAEISLHDVNSGDFSTTSGSIMAFNANNALTIRDAKTDFFKELNEMIVAVENHKAYPESEIGEMRNVGIQNAITKLDDLQDHLSRSHAMVGAQSNALTMSLERTGLLEISTMTLRSSVVDTDLAEASLTLTQLSLTYESMLSTVGKVSKLSLVNYL